MCKHEKAQKQIWCFYGLLRGSGENCQDAYDSLCAFYSSYKPPPKECLFIKGWEITVTTRTETFLVEA